MTMVPRTGPLSASSAFAITSWYQRGKSSARGVSTRAMTENPRRVVVTHFARPGPLPGDPAAQHDRARRGRPPQVRARVLVVHDQIGRAALDQTGEPEPLA